MTTSWDDPALPTHTHKIIYCDGTSESFEGTAHNAGSWAVFSDDGGFKFFQVPAHEVKRIERVTD